MDIKKPVRINSKTDRAKARVGERYGLLTTIEWLGSNKSRRAVYRFSCECGGSCVKTMALVMMVGEHSTCGCANRKPPGPLRHGHSRRGTIEKEYIVWKGMRMRCSPKCSEEAYPHYYGKGIRVCDQWSDYAKFIADMGPRPGPGYDIDRIDSNLNYAPENCHWLLRVENNKKARIEYANRMRRRIFSVGNSRRVQWLIADGMSISGIARQERSSLKTIKRILAGELHA